MRFTQLNDWLSWLEQAHPNEIDLGLDRLHKVLARMELPVFAPVITVAGTNGKGSCVAAATALLQAAGLRVGSYTSPHIDHYCERVCINAAPVSDADMCRAFDIIDRARGEISLTYFEFGTLAALVLFCQHSVDVMVLEVGLGGRLDAVNIVDADVAVITSVAIDHEAWLGNNRESIGREKAGIMRSGKIAICVDSDPPLTLLQHADDIGAKLHLLGRDFTIHTASPASGTVFGLISKQPWCLSDALDDSSLLLPPVSLVETSVVAAILAVKALGVDVAALPLADVLGPLSLPGRMQRVQFGSVPVLIDVAHNPAATTYLARQVRAQKPSGRVVAVVAMMADKDIAGSIQPLIGLVDAWLAVGLTDVPRAAEATALAAIIAQSGAQVASYPSINDALTQLSTNPHTALCGDDLLLVFGSFFTVAAALAILMPDRAQEPNADQLGEAK
ncbi:bifunctional tetrahydrofolate synthase/dihydrofolate synthase [Gilvimarinus polysaccharolyticus]|uniref:bifunctional tetrahydrofolate synthase/dihydrofolate synthase n=1 Tax=Gilvimarinus polysaccharolyticus TaxID=863921 RepID=UPI0006736ED8|nr:bifunctional tetrahydrofolate synthase/dihydrofolate synthase [Gilvimarinus polysaccharolyticus]